MHNFDLGESSAILDGGCYNKSVADQMLPSCEWRPVLDNEDIWQLSHEYRELECPGTVILIGLFTLPLADITLLSGDLSLAFNPIERRRALSHLCSKPKHA